MGNVSIRSLPKLEMPLPEYHEARCYTDENGHHHVLVIWAGIQYVDIDTFEMDEKQFVLAVRGGLEQLEGQRKQVRKKRGRH